MPQGKRTADNPEQDQALRLPREKIGGRYVTQYNPELALQIVERVAEGETINAICVRGSGFPHPVTFKRWVVNNPPLAKALNAAWQLSAQSLEEEALDTARAIRQKQTNGTQVRAFEVLLQQLRWSAERRDPAKFGTKAPVSIRVPIQINTSLDLGKTESARIDGKDIYTISARTIHSAEKAAEAVEYREINDPVVKPRPMALTGPKPKPKPEQMSPQEQPKPDKEPSRAPKGLFNRLFGDKDA